MRFSCCLLFVLTLCSGLFAQDKFQLKCSPFQAIEVRHPIDGSCGPYGTATTPGAKAQNEVKNNLCAGTTFQEITRQALIEKHKSVAKMPGYSGWSGEDLPADRSKFVSLGEGKAFQFIGCVFEAHYADLSSGESVNCQIKRDEKSNDIHIALVEPSRVPDECESITAEMIPHYRPTAWTKDAIASIGRTTLVRVSGQLMFDASHKVCGERGHKTTDPKRASDWEIHPVYAFEVCTKQSGGSCSEWEGLADWAAKRGDRARQ